MLSIQNIVLRYINKELTILVKASNIPQKMGFLQMTLKGFNWEAIEQGKVLKFAVDNSKPMYYFDRVWGVLSKLHTNALLDQTIWDEVGPKLRDMKFKELFADQDIEFDMFTAPNVVESLNEKPADSISDADVKITLTGITELGKITIRSDAGIVTINSSHLFAQGPINLADKGDEMTIRAENTVSKSDVTISASATSNSSIFVSASTIEGKTAVLSSIGEDAMADYIKQLTRI